MGGVEYQVTKVDPTDPETKGMVYQVHKVSEEVAATLGGKVYRARIIKDPSDPTVAGKVYQIVLIGDPSDPAVKGKVYNAILTGGSEAVVVGPAVSPLSLPDAIADSLEYLKAFGGTELVPETYLDTVTAEGKCEQRNLPSAYTQVEYISNDSSTKYNTGLLPQDGDVIEIRFKVLDGSISNYTFQSRTGSAASIYGVGGSGSTSVISGSNSGFSVTSNLIRIANHVYYVKLSFVNGVITLYVKDETAGTEDTQTVSFTFATTDSPYYIWGNSYNTLSESQPIYFLKVTNGNTTRLNYVSARQGATAGFYDLVTNTFISTMTQGTITAGSDVTPSPTTPMNIICNNGVLKYNQSILSFNNVVGGYTINASSGLSTSSDNRCYLNYFEITVGDVIYVQANDISNTGSYLIQYTGQSEATFVGSESATTVSATMKKVTATVNGYARLVYLGSKATAQSENWQVGINRPVGVYADGTIETITDALGNTATCENLLSVGTYEDTQEVISGAITHNVGVKVLDGTEEWSTSTNYCWNLNESEFTRTPMTVFCSHFEYTATLPSGSARWSKVCASQYGMAFGARASSASEVSDTVFLDIEDWKQWLADQYANGTPVIIVYPLETATTESVAGQTLLKAPLTTVGSLENLVVTSTSSSHTVPTPTQPLDINTNNGVLKARQNLIDLNAVTDGYYYDPQGQYSSSSSSRLTDYIPIEAGQSVTVYFKSLSTTSNLNVRINIFNSNKVWQNQEVLELVPYAEGTKIITPTANGYIRVSGNYTGGPNIVDWNTAKIVYGEYTVATIDSAIGSIYADGTVETINVHSKNLWNPSTITYTAGALSATTGQPVTSDISHYTSAIPVKPNTTYTLSFMDEVDPTPGQTMKRVHGYSTTNIVDWVEQIVYKQFQQGDYCTLTFTTPATVNYIRLSCGVGDYDFQLELDSTATPYEPYFNGGTATTEMLLKIGDYEDVQEIIDGVVTRNIGVKVLDGTEGWTRGTAIYANIPDLDAYLGHKDCYCTHFLGVNNSQQGAGLANSNKICVGDQLNQSQYRNSVYIYGTTTDFPDVTTWTNWLADQYAAGTPVIVIYPLATPTTESVAGQAMQVQQGDNIVEITQASMNNLELEAKYEKEGE